MRKVNSMLVIMIVTVINVSLCSKCFAELQYQAIHICRVGGWNGKNLTINEAGEVAGNGRYVGAFFWSEDELVTITNGYNDSAFGMNNLGHVVGITNYNVFFWDNGEFLNLGKFGGSNAQGRAINDSGQIVGYWDAYAVFIEGEEAIKIVPGCALGINNSGEVVGVHYVGGSLNKSRGFLYSNGQITNIELGYGISRAYGINESGQVVGHADAADGKYHAFSWKDGVITDLGTPGITSWAYGINDFGQVVGCIDDPHEAEAVIWNNGVMTNLNDLLLEGSECDVLECAFEINNSGQIVGRGILKEDGRDYIFLLNPVPPIPAEADIEPKTLNLSSNGKWISCHIWLPEDYDVADVNTDSILLEGQIAAAQVWVNQEQQVVTVKFSRAEVQEILEAGEVELTISGELVDGAKFEGTDSIRVIDKNSKGK